MQDWIIEGFRRATKRTGGGQSYAGRLQLTCWANVNGPGHSNDVHNHPQCAWSGVYYVDVGTPTPDEEKSGFLHFLDPRGGAGMVEDPFSRFGKGREFKPISGQMIIFRLGSYTAYVLTVETAIEYPSLLILLCWT